MTRSVERPTMAPAPRPASFLVLAGLILGASLVLPYGLIQLSPGIMRTLFPAYAFTVGLLVMNRWPSAFPAVCVGFCAFVPFLRRVADYQAGFVQANPILLGSLVILLPALPSLFRRILMPGAPLAGPLAAMVGCLMYGSFLALVGEKVVQALYEPAWYILPVALATYVMERPAELVAIRRSLTQAVLLIMPIMTVYGVLQYISPQPWDIVWMLNVDNNTFGKPMPYEVRVFSMLNSPGTAGVFTAYAMLMLSGGGLIGMLVAVAALPLLLLTIIRTAWLAVFIGLITILVVAPATQRLRLVGAFAVGILAVVLLVASPAIPVSVKNMIEDRANSFTSLGTDTSANDRRDTYASFYNRLAESPLGEGFGANGSATASVQKRDLPALDSGILEIFLTFGLPVGMIYMYSLGAIVLAAWRGMRLSRGALADCFAVLVATLAIMPLGNSIAGETGGIQWTAIGLLLTVSAQQAAKPVRAAMLRRAA